jgi:hypothetical protein
MGPLRFHTRHRHSHYRCRSAGAGRCTKIYSRRRWLPTIQLVCFRNLKLIRHTVSSLLRVNRGSPMRSLPSLRESFLLLGTLCLSGCSPQSITRNTTPTTTVGATGYVHGGQQPVSGASIQLYAVGTSGDGSAATPLLTQVVTSDANGNFSLRGLYTCPTPGSLVYVVATGGNPGLPSGTDNPSIGLMTALGTCSSLTSSTFININELTTVGAVTALAPFMDSADAIGSSSATAPLLVAAFTYANQLVNYATGSAPGTNVPVGATVPVEQLDTIANVLSACVNSGGGIAGDATPCGNLFALATPTTILPPTDTILAALYITRYGVSYLDTAALFDLVLPTAPFQPQLSQSPLYFSIHFGLPITLNLSSAALEFQSTVIGFNSPIQSLTLTNTGQSSIVLTGISIVGENATDFSQTNNCPTSLDPSTECTVQFVFSPGLAGSRAAFLNITSSVSGSPQFVSLNGAGITGSTTGSVSVSPSQLNFSLLNTPQTVTLTNLGTTPVNIGNVLTTANYSQTNSCGSQLDSQSVCFIYVSATNLNSSISGILTINDDLATSPQQGVVLQTSSSVEASGSVISFGSWAVGTTSAVQSIIVDRTSSAGVNLSVINIVGPNASSFSASGSCFSPFSCSIPVTFSPSNLGAMSATVVTNQGNFPVSGLGISAGPSFAQAWTSTPTFLYQTINTASGPWIANFTNNGTTTLQLLGSVSGTNSSDFTVGNQCGAALTISQTCNMTLSFTPTRLGTFANTFTVTDSISGLSRAFPLVSSATPPPPLANPSSHAFGNVQVGATSAPLSFIVTAPAGDPVFTTVLQYGATPSGLAITQGSTCAATPCTVTVVMTPTSTACCSTNIQIFDTVTGLATYVSPVGGTGGLPVVSLNPPGLSFAARSVGSTSIAQQVTLANVGNANLVLNSITLSGPNPGDYTQSNNCGSSLPPNGECSISVSFAPIASGTRNATIQIISNASTSPDTVSLAGIAN